MDNIDQQPTDQDLARKKFIDTHTMGIKQQESFVLGPIENKHGIDNPVQDLNTSNLLVGSTLVAGLMTIDLTALTAPRTYTGQNVAGTLTLQSGSLTSTRVPFANSSGLLVDSANMTFVTDTLTVTNLGTATTIGSAYVYRVAGTDVAVTDGGTGVSAIAAKSIWLANSANTITSVTPAASQSIRINVGNTAWEAYTPATGTMGGSTGSVDNAVLRADGTGGVTLQTSALILNDVTSKNAILDFSLLATTDKTFTFMNDTGSFVTSSSFDRSTAQIAAKSLTAYTVGAADSSFYVSANVNVTTATTHNFTVTCTYTDETNTSRTLTFGFTQLSGATLLTAITNVTGAGPYESIPYHIRAKAGTTITIASTGTFTTVTYNLEGSIIKIN